MPNKMNIIQKRKNFVDGLNYDTKKKQFYTINYGWGYIIEDLKETNYRDIKSGITGLGLKDAMSVSTRYKSDPQEKIFESRKYIPKYATLKQANEIVKRMDDSFKYSLDNELGWSKRKITNNNTIGTEWYRVPITGGIQTIKEKWEDAFSQACFTVLRDSKGFDPEDYEVSGAWPQNLEIIDEYYEDNDKGRFIATTGYGKGYLAWLTAYLSKRGKKSPIKVYYTNNISNTKQLAHAHDEKYESGNGNGTKIVVCSNKKKVKTRYTEIDVYSAQDGQLKSLIKSAMKYGHEISFYVNRHSAGQFNTIFNRLSKELNYTNEVCTIIDEIQEFTGDTSLRTTQAVVNPIKNSWMMGMTATEERRDPSDDRTDVIKNDDVEHFGNIIYEVTATEAILLGRHTPVDFISLVMGNGCDLTEMVSKNKVIKAYMKQHDPLVRGRLLRSLSAIVYGIKQGKNKIIALNSMIVDADSMMRMLDMMKQEGIIPQDFVIVNGKNNNKINGPEDFEKEKKAIFVCTPWSITGLDLPSADCGVCTYDFGKDRVARQWIGRTTRVPDGNLDKRALIIIGLDYYDSNPNNLPTLMFVKEHMVNDLNTHSTQAPKKAKQYNPIAGSRIQKVVTHQVVRGQMGSSTEPDLEADWDLITNAINTDELGSLDLYKVHLSRVERMLENYDNLSEVYEMQPALYRALRRYENTFGFGVFGKFGDYSELPNDINEMTNYITTKYKNFSDISEGIQTVIRTKYEHLQVA